MKVHSLILQLLLSTTILALPSPLKVRTGADLGCGIGNKAQEFVDIKAVVCELLMSSKCRVMTLNYQQAKELDSGSSYNTRRVCLIKKARLGD
jgi:hypothetical protein